MTLNGGWTYPGVNYILKRVTTEVTRTRHSDSKSASLVSIMWVSCDRLCDCHVVYQYVACMSKYLVSMWLSCDYSELPLIWTPEMQWGHPCIEATSKCPKVCFLVQIYPWNEATPVIRTLWQVPRVAGLEGVHCSIWLLCDCCVIVMWLQGRGHVWWYLTVQRCQKSTTPLCRYIGSSNRDNSQ